MYGFATELVGHLREKDFLVLLISGSPIEMVSRLADVLGVDTHHIAAGQLEVVDSYIPAIQFHIREVRNKKSKH